MEPISLSQVEMELFAWYLHSKQSANDRPDASRRVYIAAIATRFMHDRDGLALSRDDPRLNDIRRAVEQALIGDPLWAVIAEVKQNGKPQSVKAQPSLPAEPNGGAAQKPRPPNPRRSVPRRVFPDGPESIAGVQVNRLPDRYDPSVVLSSPRQAAPNAGAPAFNPQPSASESPRRRLASFLRQARWWELLLYLTPVLALVGVGVFLLIRFLRAL